MNEKTTPCECPLAGFCNRHGVQKSSHLHKLCQNHIGYFNMWERCQGPNQDPNNCVKNDSQEGITRNLASEETKLPSTMQMAKNFLQSAAKHIQSGMTNVGEDMQKERLAICAECPHAVEDGSRCGKCGCFLQHL